MTKTDAITVKYRQVLFHAHEHNQDGSAVRCRVNGRCKTWKTRKDAFQLPVKCGLTDCFYITPDNMSDWLLTEEV